MFKNSFGLILGMLLLAGCGYKESVVQNNDIAYLEFSRNSFESLTVHINESRYITLERCNPEEGCDENIRYEVPTGTLLIEVFDKTNNQIYRDNFYLGSGNIKKVVLP